MNSPIPLPHSFPCPTHSLAPLIPLPSHSLALSFPCPPIPLPLPVPAHQGLLFLSAHDRVHPFIVPDLLNVDEAGGGQAFAHVGQ